MAASIDQLLESTHALFNLDGNLTGTQLEEIEKAAEHKISNRKLRIAIVTENFLPASRTPARS